ncbi:MAG: hypothetical protein AMJ92_05390 [candidate division Zixibacteria bacterium SM23_81]|nr:MAG: hypothetical protein AMJ92_05390 [candidate division Zixibacteria bacterium SM23_81]
MKKFLELKNFFLDISFLGYYIATAEMLIVVDNLCTTLLGFVVLSTTSFFPHSTYFHLRKPFIHSLFRVLY